MSESDPLFEYVSEVLGFDFKDARPVEPPAVPPPAAVQRMVERCAGAFSRSGRERVVLLGLGSGAVAETLAGRLPVGSLLVCEQNLGLARSLLTAGRLLWSRPGQEGEPPAARLAVDSSPWALLMLLDRCGVVPGEVMVLPNPELPPAEKARMRLLELLLTRCEPFVAPPGPLLGGAPDSPMPKISAAAILSPDEPGLPEFLAQLPPWLLELAIVWDAEVIPDVQVPRHFPVWQTARPLERDFAAQRNLMLAACRGDFVLYLDADEGFCLEDWAALPGLCAAPDVCGWLFPRVTPYPNIDRALTGFGLWPDLQLRLFRRTEDLRFFNAVHERLTGLCGRQALALDMELLHMSRLRKSDAELRRKLRGFDEAGTGAVRHALSPEYPSVPRGLLRRRGQEEPAAQRCLLLPPELG